MRPIEMPGHFDWMAKAVLKGFRSDQSQSEQYSHDIGMARVQNPVPLPALVVGKLKFQQARSHAIHDIVFSPVDCNYRGGLLLRLVLQLTMD